MNRSRKHIDPNRIEGALQAIVGRLQDGLGRATGNARTRARGKARWAVGSAQRSYGEALDSARDVMAEAATHVEKRPFLSVLIAGTVGYGLAMLGRRH